MGSFGSILHTHQDYQTPRVRKYSSPYTFCVQPKSNQVSPIEYTIYPLPPVLPPRIVIHQRPIVPITLAKSIHLMDEPAIPTTVLSILQESTKV
jgi:hypothetical protein